MTTSRFDPLDDPTPKEALMITDAQSTDDLWDANDVARYLKASRSWVYHQAEAGKLPHLRIGALLRFDPAKVKAFAHGDSERGGKVLSMRPRTEAERE
jgi:excisionase family DNA binding protein